MDAGDSSHDAQAGDTAEPNPSEMTEGFWSTSTFDDNTPTRGFLQMCAERRFYRAIQEKFEELTGLKHYQYWIHTDAGGSPKMSHALHKVAPDYCYGKQGVRIMGWAAHGMECGGYDPPNTPDEDIRDDLINMLSIRMNTYPLADHYAFFAIGDKKDPPGVTVWCTGPHRRSP
jgi:hypothetical protein